MAEYSNPEVLVTTQWLADHLNDPKIRIVEVDVDTSAYDQGHVPGAVGWNWQTQLQDPVRRDLVDKRVYEELLGRTRIMNGGRKKWLEEKRPLSTEAPRLQPTTYRAKDPEQTIRARRDEIFAVLDRRSPAQLVDVRSLDEFTGKIIAPPGMSETAQRGGHIPGAVSVPWAQAVNEDGTFKTADALKQLYAGKGVTGDREVIAYCRIGERSSHTWFVLKYLLGYGKVRNYDGSWTDWGYMVGAPIEKEIAAAAR